MEHPARIKRRRPTDISSGTTKAAIFALTFNLAPNDRA
jgi:hypothetical protein